MTYPITGFKETAEIDHSIEWLPSVWLPSPFHDPQRLEENVTEIQGQRLQAPNLSISVIQENTNCDQDSMPDGENKNRRTHISVVNLSLHRWTSPSEVELVRQEIPSLPETSKTCQANRSLAESWHSSLGGGFICFQRSSLEID